MSLVMGFKNAGNKAAEKLNENSLLGIRVPRLTAVGLFKQAAFRINSITWGN